MSDLNSPSHRLSEMENQVADIHAKVTEIHAFLNGIAQALNNPMLAAMLPPQMRAMIPGK